MKKPYVSREGRIKIYRKPHEPTRKEKKRAVICILLLCAANICCVSNNKTNEGQYVTWPNGIRADAGIPKDVVYRMSARFKAIENGDIRAFRSTLGEMEDGVDYYYQLGLLYKYFGDLFDIDPEAFDNAVAAGNEDLQEIANKLFYGEPPPKKRNTGLKIKTIGYLPAGGLVVTAINNKHEELEFVFTYY